MPWVFDQIIFGISDFFIFVITMFVVAHGNEHGGILLGLPDLTLHPKVAPLAKRVKNAGLPL